MRRGGANIKKENNGMDNFAIAGVSLTGILGIAAFLVSVIVEVTKKIKPFSLIPTQLWCMIVALVVCIAAYLGYCAYSGIAVVWYFLACAIMAGFIAAYIAMYGWDTMKSLYDRFVNDVKKE